MTEWWWAYLLVGSGIGFLAGLMGIGGGLVVAYASAKYRDLPHLLNVVLGVLFWMMPIVYHWNQAPGPLSPFIQYNPFSLLISPTQIVLHGGAIPSLPLLSASYLIAGMMLIIGIVAAGSGLGGIFSTQLVGHLAQSGNYGQIFLLMGCLHPLAMLIAFLALRSQPKSELRPA